MLNEHELDTREALVAYFTRYITRELNKVNAGFRFMRIETPILRSSKELRETTKFEAYAASRLLLSGTGRGRGTKLPIVIWQHGKIFEKGIEGLHEKYHLEYQILYSNTTHLEYGPILSHSVANMLHKQCGAIREVWGEMPSPVTYQAYSTAPEPLVTIRRDNFWSGHNIEVVFDMDRCLAAALIQEQVGRKKLTARSNTGKVNTAV